MRLWFATSKQCVDSVVMSASEGAQTLFPCMGCVFFPSAPVHVHRVFSCNANLLSWQRRVLQPTSCRLKHRHFLRTAADRCAVKQAMRFVQLLPRRYADTRTYNMLVTVCGAAGDVTSALHAADMLRSTGGKPDTIMYTNLIAGVQSPEI